MEENNSLTVERSLEIIKGVIEKNRNEVTERLRVWLMVSGIVAIAVAWVLGVVGMWLPVSSDGGLLLFVPLSIWAVVWWLERKREVRSPYGVVGESVKKVWTTFVLLAIFYWLFAEVANFMMLRLSGSLMEFAVIRINAYPALWLLMGMTIAVTGMLLKKNVVVVCGVVAGLGASLFWHFGLLSTLLVSLSSLGVEEYARCSRFAPHLYLVFFCLIGMILPAMLLKKNAKQSHRS